MKQLMQNTATHSQKAVQLRPSSNTPSSTTYRKRIRKKAADMNSLALTDRWLGLGLDPEQARNRALANDIPNAELVIRKSLKADLEISSAP